MKQQGNGYQKFFKEARQVSREGAPAAKASSTRNSAAKQASSGNSRSIMSKNLKSNANPEQALKAALAERMKQRQAEVKAKKKAKFPVGSALVLVMLIGGVTAGILYPDEVQQLTSKVDIGFLGSANAAGAEKSAPSAVKQPAKVAQSKDQSKAEGEEKAATTEAPAKSEQVADTRNWTPEELSFFNKLNERKEELDLKEAELAKLEEELQQQKNELETKIQQLEKMRSEISGVLKEKVATDEAKVDKLVQVYSGMKPQQAARVIETINEDLAVEILDKMKKKSASEILNMMDAAKARRLSETLAGYRQPAQAANTDDAAAE